MYDVKKGRPGYQTKTSTDSTTETPASTTTTTVAEGYNGETTGFSFTAHSTTLATSSTTKDNDMFNMLVESGATNHYYLDSKLLPGLDMLLYKYATLEKPQVITTDEIHQLHGVATGVLPMVMYDSECVNREVTLEATTVPGLGRQLFSTGAAR